MSGEERGGLVMAFLGKGGTGKTALSALTARLLLPRARRLLLVDADPGLGLCLALGERRPRTVGEVREEVIRRVKAGGEDKERLSLTVDYLMLEALDERSGYSLLAMGRTEGPGCYCPVNSLLRESIEELARAFEVIVIDAEAGIEQVSRQVTRRVDLPFIVSDGSVRGAAAAVAIADALKRSSHRAPAGVIFNRLESPPGPLVARLAAAGLACLGAVPEDDDLARLDREGRSLLELPLESPALAALAPILARSGLALG